MNTSTPDATQRDKLLILAAICLSALVLPLAFSGGAVATPAIGRDLGAHATALTWITNAFMLSFGSLLMAAGALADQFGRKKLFVLGLGGFIATSFAMSFAPSVLVLDLLRGAQGVAAAASLSSGAAALAQEFDGHARTRAFSMLGTSFGIGLDGRVWIRALMSAFQHRVERRLCRRRARYCGLRCRSLLTECTPGTPRVTASAFWICASESAYPDNCTTPLYVATLIGNDLSAGSATSACFTRAASAASSVALSPAAVAAGAVVDLQPSMNTHAGNANAATISNRRVMYGAFRMSLMRCGVERNGFRSGLLRSWCTCPPSLSPS